MRRLRVCGTPVRVPGGGLQDGYRKRTAWLLIGSIAAHTWALAAVRASTTPHIESAPRQQLWLEALPASQQQAPPAPEPPPPETEIAEPARPSPHRVASPARARAPQPSVVVQQPDLPADAPVSEAPGDPRAAEQAPSSSQDGSSDEDGAPVGSRSSSFGVVGGTATGSARALPPQFSLWLTPPELQRMVIVRSPIALLAALPGYRDMLRGSDIAPFSNLRALRVFLPGLSAERLVLAGVHADGEDAIVRAAERVANARERVPSWRGPSTLRATSWLDGSGYDRGLAVQGDAFLIGARRELPRWLGQQSPSARVRQLSKSRHGVLVLAVVHEVTHYLPALGGCKLRNLRLSISNALRLHLSAEYETEESAAHAASCFAGLDEAVSQLRWTTELLSRATGVSASTRTQLRTTITSEGIAKLLDEICWSLRRTVHG